MSTHLRRGALERGGVEFPRLAAAAVVGEEDGGGALRDRAREAPEQLLHAPRRRQRRHLEPTLHTKHGGQNLVAHHNRRIRRIQRCVECEIALSRRNHDRRRVAPALVSRGECRCGCRARSAPARRDHALRAVSSQRSHRRNRRGGRDGKVALKHARYVVGVPGE
jgi:hypothetical protein